MKKGIEIELLEKRASMNKTASDIGVRPVGEVRARLAEIKAMLEKYKGETPERIEDLLDFAQHERDLDEVAQKIQRLMKNPSGN